MFDSLAIRATAPFRARIDLGEIAEALLFYGTVHLFLSEGELTELIQKVGCATTLALAESGHSRITLLRDGAATHSVGPPGDETYDFITWQRARTKGQLRDPQEIAAEAFLRASQRKGQSRRAAQRLLRSANVSSLSDPLSDQSPVCDRSREDVRDPQYVQFAIAEAVSAVTGELPPPGWRFDVVPAGERLRVVTNLDFAALTARVQARFGPDHNLTPALLLDFLHQARVDLHLAASIGSELLTSPLSSLLVGHRIRRELQAATTNKLEDIRLFQNVALQGHSVGDAVRSGHKTLDQVLQLADKAERFRSWLAARPADSTLLAEYYAAVTRESWVEHLPGKSLRFALFTGLGMSVDMLIPTGLGTAVGIAAGAVDSFLVDRLVKGWTPGQFVDRDLLPFLKRR
jgi:hypothetical protein